MNANTTTARTVGALFLLATASYYGGTQLIESVFDAPDYLARLHPERIRVVAGAVLVIADALIAIGIAIAMFSILKRWSKRAALGYLVSRVIEAALLVVGVLGPLALISVSREYVAVGAPAPSNLALIGILAGKSNYWAYQMAMIVCGAGGLVFCGLLLRSKLVPPFLSVLGAIGYPLLAVGAILDMMGVVDTLRGTGMLLIAPGALFELVFPLWLIARGFDFPRTQRPSAWESATA